MGDALYDVLMPRTDAGVLMQVVLLGVLVLAGLYATWRSRELRLLVAGAGMFVLGLMALRAVH